MLTDKQIKEKYKPKFWKDPDRYYPTEVLREAGFHRGICDKCKKPFWNLDLKRKVCGDPVCSDQKAFDFIGNTPAKKPMSYLEIWKEFSEMFKNLGYTPVKRYPVVSRWNPTMEYVNASIAAFQPYVISGEVSPPANPLVIPQFCLRFSDIDNVGITMSHMTCFNMIGQHMFVAPEKWDQNQVFKDIKKWLNQGLGLPDEELTFHEDAWAGGGNLGCCMEYFSRGCELGNQVYMLYEQTPSGVKDLNIKVLDMGMGMERNAWFSQGVNSIYDATFPFVVKNLLKKTKEDMDTKLIRKFVPYAGQLNLDEVEDIDKKWKQVSTKIDMPVEELKNKIERISAIYSIGEHARTLLIALSDGALPSNVGGGYNLRILARRCFGFIDKYGWKLSLPDVCRWHAEELTPEFPELKNNLEEVSKILDVEKKKYIDTKKKSRRIIAKILAKGGDITEELLIELYDTKGISPEDIQEQGKKLGKKIKIPNNFYAKVSELHEDSQKMLEKEEQLDLKDVSDTDILYYKSFDIIEFDAVAEKIIENKVILNRTAFYPTSGGQLHDKGTLNKEKVVEVYRQGGVVVHELEDEPNFRSGDKVHGKIDFERRLQLAQHHTATHIINGAARQILGNHIWQAGAHKDLDKARLDITHYDSLKDVEVKKIEKLSNEIIDKNLPVYSTVMDRQIAETEYGMRIYQGGAVPGKKIRIINIKGFDVEACGGTHLNLTGETKLIKILKTSKIQDGIVRIEFTAGTAAMETLEKQMEILQEAARILSCQVNQVPGRAEELFKNWKKARKAVKKNREIDFSELELSSNEETDGNLLKKTADILRTQPKHVTKTLRRFSDQLDKFKEKIGNR
ncbi:alanine--tRNA ligase [Candidatus Woesearchaeota archaeon]|nr:alanine--tRNA ligase [Candidatus Woesearchaeota archaeon]